MKTILRKIILSATALLLATAVHAYDFSVDNEDGVTIRYNILSLYPRDGCIDIQSESSHKQHRKMILRFPLRGRHFLPCLLVLCLHFSVIHAQEPTQHQTTGV